MKNIKIYIIALFYLILTSNSYSQNIVYANLDTIIKTSDVGKKIIVFFKDKNNKLNKEYKNKEKIIRENEASLISQKNILENEEYIKKANEINQEINKFNLEYNQKMKEINFQKDEVLKSFQNEINKILKEFAENNNIDIILSSNQMLIGKSNMDVTDKILKNVNNKIKNFNIN